MLRIIIFWTLLAALALVLYYLRLLTLSFDGDYQGWASASCMTMAHSFRQLGILHTHFVPIQNNLPLGSDPDVYLHWPPLYPILLSVVTTILGDHESSGRLFALAISLVTAAIVFGIAHRLYGTRVAWLACFFFLTARATYEGGRAVLHQPLAILFGTSIVLFFLLALPENSPEERPKPLYVTLGLVASILTMLTAWDPVFIPMGLFAGSLYLRRRAAARIAALYTVAGILTFCLVQADYIASYPTLFRNQFATIAYRAGLHFNASSSLSLHTIVDHVHYSTQLSLIGAYSHAIRFAFDEFNVFLLLAGFLFLAFWLQSDRRTNAPAIYILAGLGAPWILFYLLMRNYVSIHSFALVLGAPFLAIAAGYTFDRILETLLASSASSARPNHYLLYASAICVPLLSIYPLLMAIRDARTPYEAAQFQSLSAVVRQNTPTLSVTLSPSESAVPVYYADRHFVRGIETPELLRSALAQAHRDFPNTPLFFALRDADAPAFQGVLPTLHLDARQGDASLYTLP